MDWINTFFQEILSQNFFIALIMAFIAGILTSATPCVYPLIPIIVGVIGAQDAKNKITSFYLSVLYVLGMAIVYSALGIIAASTGKIFGQVSTHPIVFFIVGLIFLLFSFWMFGWINISQIGPFKNYQPSEKAGLLSIFLLGATSGLVTAPCTTPVLGLLLIYVATTGKIILGGLLLFSFAFGMGALLILIGTSVGAAKTLPKPGAWMVKLKQFLALIMFFVAIYFLIKAISGLI